ncbi:MAG: hypothetical protein IJ343_11170 [Clostridia bacterium]|nr:hypothetical protein [Clostridia bacterium]
MEHTAEISAVQTPLTKKRIQDHLAYSWWKYGLLIIIAAMGWNIIYSMTEYRPPEEKKVIVGVYSAGSDTNLAAYMEKVQQTLLPEMEDVSPMYIMPDEAYGDMILTTRIVANECDIYILPGTQFQNWAAQGAFMPLDELLPELEAELTEAGVSLSRGRRQNTSTGEKHLYGIPCKDLPAAMEMLWTDTSDLYISVFHNTGNDENVLRFMDIFVRDLMKEPAPTAEPASTAEPAPAA